MERLRVHPVSLHRGGSLPPQPQPLHAHRCAARARARAPPAPHGGLCPLPSGCRSYVPLANIELVDDLLPKSCDDSMLTPVLKSNCRRCCGILGRDTCLFKSEAQSWNEGEGEQPAGPAW